MNAFSDKVKATVQSDLHQASLCKTSPTPTSAEVEMCNTIKELQLATSLHLQIRSCCLASSSVQCCPSFLLRSPCFRWVRQQLSSFWRRADSSRKCRCSRNWLIGQPLRTGPPASKR